MGKAPAHGSRFVPGQSGNPRGRPRRAKVRDEGSAFDIVLDRLVPATLDGVARELSVDELLQQRIYKDALTGKRLAIREVLKWIERREKSLPPRSSRAASIEMRVEQGCRTHADDAMLLLGIATIDAVRQQQADDTQFLLLEPWAVQMALSRRTGAPLGDKDRAEVKRLTRSADTLRWPRGSE